MKLLKPILIIILIVLGIIFISSAYKKDSKTQPTISTEEDITGCYAMNSGNDIYTLTIESQQGTAVSGTLVFKNYQKDSSRGLFVGTFENDILRGTYSFQSEGMNSVMEVAFKKTRDTFVRGYGQLNQDGTRFADGTPITYDGTSALSVFKKGACLV